jgi:hypothetical protein
MTSPLLMHFLLRPAIQRVSEAELPVSEEVCRVFADAFLRAVAVSSSPVKS